MGSRSVVAAFTLLAAAACNAITSADDLSVRETDGADAASTRADGGAIDAPGNDDGGVPLVRCDAMRVCLPNDAGWVPVVLMDVADAPCQAEYPSATTLFGDRKGGGCQCACAPVGGTCTPSVTLGFGGGNCSTSSTMLDLPVDGTCASVPPFNLSAPLRVTTTSAGPTSCTSKSIADIRAPAPARLCQGATPSAGSSVCGSGQQCVPEAVFGGQNCVAHEGDVACPGRFPSRLLLGPTYVDSRECSACQCGPDGCAGTTVALSNDEKCSFAPSNPANGNCFPVVFNAGVIRSAKIGVGGGCKVTVPSKPTGSLTFNTPTSVCCS